MFDFVTRLFAGKETSPPEGLAESMIAPPEPQPAQSSPAPTEDIIPAPVSPPPKSGNVISVPYRDIVVRLPASVAPLASSSVTGVYSLPVETAMAQLPTGAVRVRFADLRQSAPAGNFAENGSCDDTLVDLPLAQILAGLNPTLLTRRVGQRQVDLPEDVDVAFKPHSQPAAPRPMVEPLPAVIHKLSDPVEPPKAIASVPEPAPVLAPEPVPVPALEVQPTAPVVQAAPPPPVALVAPVAPVVPPKPSVDAVHVRLLKLWEFWPENVRQEITQSNWGDASLSLPMKRLETAMKSGRVAFAWSELIQWLDVAPPSTPTQNGNTMLDIPLKVVAPLFMSQRRPAVAQKTVSIGDNVPDLFALPATAPRVEPIPAPELPPEPVAETPAPTPVIEIPTPVVEAAPEPVAVSQPAPALAPTPVPEPVVDTVASAPAPVVEVMEQKVEEPAKADGSPQEIVQQINALPGVAASLIAMSDGFLVAGDLPAPLKGEMTAAFLPQMFGRQAHYAKEIQLGAPSELCVVANERPFKIFKAGTLFLAVLGKTGETLPEAQLRAVATELAKRNP